MQSTTKPIIEALEKIAGRIAQEFDIRSRVSLVVGASGGGTKHGHFLADGWMGKDGEPVHEIVMTGESLERGAVPTLGTMIHELAHLYNHENDIKDVSDSGRYHNRDFRRTAEGMGLAIEQAPRIGHSVTSVPEETQRKFSEEIMGLDKAITAWRRPPMALAASATPAKKFMFGCPECDDPVQVTKGWGERNDVAFKCRLHDTYAIFWVDD